MGILAGIDLAFQIFQKLNVSVGQAITFYHTVIRPANPDAPDLTDAEIIAKMKAGFTSEREIAQAALAALRTGEADPDGAPAAPAETQLRVTQQGDGAPSADRVGSPKPGTPAPYDPVKR